MTLTQTLPGRHIPLKLNKGEEGPGVPSDRKRVQVQYRRLDDPQRAFGNGSLQDAIERALNAEHNGGAMRSHPDRRTQDDDSTYGTLMLNKIGENGDHFFGELVRFEKGAQLTMLSMVEEGGAYDLVQASTPENHEALKGVLYFLVCGSHLVFIPGDIAAGRLEKYLKWLLAVASDTISSSAGVVLAADIEYTPGTTPVPPIGRVAYSPPLFRPADFDQQGLELEPGLSRERQEVSSHRTLEVLRAAGTNETDIQQLMAENTDVGVTVEITFRSGRKIKPIGLDMVGRIFRNVEPEELTLKDQHGMEIRGKLIKLSYPTDVLTVGSLLDWRDAARKLLIAYKHFVDSGHIQP